MWWGYPHLPNSALVKEIIPKGFDALVGRPATDCIRLHLNRTDATDGMAYSADAAVTAGNSWTASFWARSVTPSAVGVVNSFSIYNYGGPNTPANPSRSWTLGPVGVWQKYSLTFTANNPLAISYWFSGAGGIKYDIANIQYELGTIANNFAPGTRTNTQAVLDWTGRNTITAESLTYASNGTFSFNGTSDYLSVPVVTGTTRTVCIVYKLNNPSSGWGPMWRFDDWRERIFPGTITLINSNTTYYNLNGPPNNTSIVHIAYSYNGTNAKSYLNGVLQSNITMDGPMNTGTYTYNFGRQAGGSTVAFVDMTLYTVQFYDIQLTDDQVAQNFNAIRSRFGI
jgi:hypothetical protein